MPGYPDARVQRTDPHVVLLAVALAAIAFTPIMALGALTLLAWRAARGYIGLGCDLCRRRRGYTGCFPAVPRAPPARCQSL